MNGLDLKSYGTSLKESRRLSKALGLEIAKFQAQMAATTIPEPEEVRMPTWEELKGMGLPELWGGLIIDKPTAEQFGLDWDLEQGWIVGIHEALETELGYELREYGPGGEMRVPLPGEPGMVYELEPEEVAPYFAGERRMPETPELPTEKMTFTAEEAAAFGWELPEGFTFEIEPVIGPTPTPPAPGEEREIVDYTAWIVSPEGTKRRVDLETLTPFGEFVTAEGEIFSEEDILEWEKFAETQTKIEHLVGAERADIFAGWLEEGDIPLFIAELVREGQHDRRGVEQVFRSLGLEELGIKPEFYEKFWGYLERNELTSKKVTEYIARKQQSVLSQTWNTVAGGAFGAFHQFVDMPFKMGMLELKAKFELLVGRNKELNQAIIDRIELARNQYGGMAALGMPEYEHIWTDYVRSHKGLEKWIGQKVPYIHPAYFIPIGESIGLTAKLTSRIPLIGKSLEKTAVGVQAVEKGIAKPIAKPVELGFKGMEKVGAKVGKGAADRLIQRSKTLEKLVELPTMQHDIEGALVDNWMKSALTTVAKIPPVRKFIETGLGWRILVKRESQLVEDIVGRGAVGWNMMKQRGINAANLKVMELRSIVSDPVGTFGFKAGYSSKMARRLLPEYAGERELAGTLEHIITKPEMYSWKGMNAGLEYVARINETNTLMTNLLRAEGVEPQHVVEEWIHRVVEDTGVKGAPPLRRGGRAVGAKPSYEKHRKFETMADGIQWFAEHPELGKQYASNPELSVSEYIRQGFKKIADTRLDKYVEEFGITPAERLAERFPDIVARAELTKTELADAAKFGAIINRAIRGEKLPEGTLKAMERRFPELGRRFRGLSQEPGKEATVRDYLIGTRKTLPSMTKMRESFEGMSLEERLAYRANAERLVAEQGDKGAQRILRVLDDVDIKISPETAESAPKELFDLPHPTQPGGKPKVTSLSQEEYAQLAELHQKAGLPPPDVAIKPRIEGVKGLEAEGLVAKVTYDLPPVKTAAIRKAELTALRDEVKALTEARKGPYWQARAARAEKMELVRQPEIGEGYIMQPFAGGKIYDQKFIDGFNKFFGYQPGIPGLKVTSDIAGILRITKAALDLSAMAIQGLPSFGLAHSYLLTDPVVGAKLMGQWYKALFESSRAFLDPSVSAAFVAKNRQIAMQRIAFGGSSRSVDYFAALERETGLGGAAARAMRKIPFHPYERAETSFFAAGEMVRDEFWRILGPKAIERGQGYELARILDRITGIINPEALGVPLWWRQVEQTFVWFAPSYTRACLTVLADIFRGGYTGSQARRAIGGMLGAGAVYFSATQYSIAKAQGLSDEEAWRTVLDAFCVYQDPITGEWEWRPSGRFMTLNIGNYNFGFGGFWYGLLRLAGNVNATVAGVGEREFIDLFRILKDGSLNKKDNPFIYWWYSRSSALFGTGFEMASGKDFLGYPIEGSQEYARYIATRFEPIWMEQGINWMIPGFAREQEIPEDGARAAVIPAEIFGMRTFPESAWVRFYDKTKDYIQQIPEDELDPKQKDAWEEGRLEWRHLTEIQQMNLRNRHADLDGLYQKAIGDSLFKDSEDWKQWTGVKDELKGTYYKRGDNLIGRLQAGEMDTREFRENWSDAGQNYGIALDTLEKDPSFEDIYDYFEKRAEEEPEYGFMDDIALAEYESIMFADYADEYGDMDWDAKDRAVADYIEKWGIEQYNKIREMYATKKEMEGLNPILIRLAEDKDKLGREYWQIPYDPLDPEPGREARAEYRRNNPEADAILALWGYGGKLQTMEAYDLVVKWGRELGIPLEQMGLGLPPQNLVQNYFDYNALPSAGNERKWFRVDNPAFEDWGQETYGWTPIEEQSIMPRDIFALYEDYNKLDKGDARLEFRYNNPEFEKWLIEEEGYTPLGDRGEPEPETPDELQKLIDKYWGSASGTPRKLLRWENPTLDAWLVAEKGFKPIKDWWSGPKEPLAEVRTEAPIKVEGQPTGEGENGEEGEFVPDPEKVDLLMTRYGFSGVDAEYILSMSQYELEEFTWNGEPIRTQGDIMRIVKELSPKSSPEQIIKSLNGILQAAQHEHWEIKTGKRERIQTLVGLYDYTEEDARRLLMYGACTNLKWDDIAIESEDDIMRIVEREAGRLTVNQIVKRLQDMLEEASLKRQQAHVRDKVKAIIQGEGLAPNEATQLRELADFLIDSEVDLSPYEVDEYVCHHFAVDLVKEAAFTTNIRLDYCTIRKFKPELYHAICSFRVGDLTLYVEPQSDKLMTRTELIATYRGLEEIKLNKDFYDKARAVASRLQPRASLWQTLWTVLTPVSLPDFLIDRLMNKIRKAAIASLGYEP